MNEKTLADFRAKIEANLEDTLKIINKIIDETGEVSI